MDVTANSEVKMGDHPVVWANPRMKARNVYILMGHQPVLLKNENHTGLLRNSILWAAGKSSAEVSFAGISRLAR